MIFCIRLGLVLTLVLTLPSFTQASLQVGDTIRFFNGPGSLGGEFGVAKLPDANTKLFITFCLERNEFIDFHRKGFVIDSITQAAEAGGVAGGSPDPISAETAWLYYSFVTGTLLHYDGSATRANMLQHAIWRLEDETYNVGQSMEYYALAEAADANEKAEALERVRVLNISWATDRHDFSKGERAQSLLYAIPEASTMVVWGVLSQLGLAAYRRRSQRN